jgi:hypothetical protein
MAALTRMTAAQMPPPFWHYPTAATRRLIGARYADMLEVGLSGSGHLVYEALRVVGHTVSPMLDGTVMGGVTRIATKKLYRGWIRENRGDRPPWRTDAVPNWRLDKNGRELVTTLRRLPVVRALRILG